MLCDLQFFLMVSFIETPRNMSLSHCLKYILFISQFSTTIVFQFILDIVVFPRDIAAFMQNFEG